MTSGQKVAKGFGLFLAVMIVLSIVSAAVTGILVLYRLDPSNPKKEAVVEYDDSDEFEEQHFEKLEDISIDVGSITLTVKEGSENLVRTRNIPDSYYVDYNNGKLTIRSQGNTNSIGDFFAYLFDDDKDIFRNGEIEVTVAAGTNLDSVALDLGSGKTFVSGLTAGNFVINSGSGSVQVEKINTKNLVGDFGSGSVVMERTSARDARFDNGSGRFFYGGVVEETLDIDGGSGSIAVELYGQPGDYNMKFDAGSGGIMINGNKADSLVTIGAEKRKNINIDGGSGMIKIDFTLAD